MLNSQSRVGLLCLVCASAILAACGGGSGGGGTDLGPGTPPPTGGMPPQVAVTDVYTQLSFSQPTVLRQAPGDDSRWFVGEKSGFIRVFANNPSSSLPRSHSFTSSGLINANI